MSGLKLADKAVSTPAQLHNRSAIYFSNFIVSALKRWMPSAVFSVAIAFSLNSQRNLFSSRSRFWMSLRAAISVLSLRVTDEVGHRGKCLSVGRRVGVHCRINRAGKFIPER